MAPKTLKRDTRSKIISKRKTLKNSVKHTYLIHDNGSSPFKVEDYGNKVSVYKIVYDTNGVADKFGIFPSHYEHIFDTPYKTIFIGMDPLKASPYWQPSFKGNTILLQLSKGRYMFIGWKIYEFNTIDSEDIDKYYSPVGNNDFPYPYAVGKNNTYLLIEDVSLPNKLLDLKKDAYMQYYTDLKKSGTKLKYKLIHKRIF